jgi:hypothetical protein
LSHLYARLQALPKVAELDQLPEVVTPPMTNAPQEAALLQSLDDLVVIAAVTQPWPPHLDAHMGMMSFDPARVINNMTSNMTSNHINSDTRTNTHTHTNTNTNTNTNNSNSMRATVNALAEDASTAEGEKARVARGKDEDAENDDNGEDETDEMDAVAGAER